MKFMRFFYIAVTALLVPVALIFLGVRILLSSAFLEIEYRMPGFPADNYGFTLKDRLKWSKLAVEYLVNDSNIDFLGNQTFPDGSVLYNDRELSHMLDVKKVVKPVLNIGYISWILLATLGFFAYRNFYKPEFRKGIRLGGWIMLGLIGGVGLFAAISFWNFFTIFHSLFFEGESWIFLYSDTLIRLFPLRFWQDVFIMVGLITLFGSMALLAGTKDKRINSG